MDFLPFPCDDACMDVLRDPAARIRSGPDRGDPVWPVIIRAKPGVDGSVATDESIGLAASRIDAILVGVVSVKDHTGGRRRAVLTIDRPGQNEWLTGLLIICNPDVPAQAFRVRGNGVAGSDTG